MSPGQYISGVSHVALISWLLIGWGLNHDPLDFDVIEVAMVSGEEYDQLVRATTPNPQPDAPDAPAVPVIEETPTPPATEPDVAPAQDTPPPTEAPAEEAPPPAPPAPPTPPAEVQENVPDLVQPVEPPSAADLTESPRPVPRPSPRIADTPAPPPPPEAETAPEVQVEVAPDAQETPEVAEEAQEATAPQEAAPEIVTEAETPSGAVETSVRPRSRPNRPAPQPAEPETRTAEAPAPANQAPQEDAVAAALADALASAPQPTSAPVGPPMTGSEREAFRVAVNGCWNVDPGAEWARVTVTVGFDLGQDGKVVGNTVRLLSSTGGTAAQAETAYQTARRAILRCQGSGGYDLPADKYDHWKEVEITFDPTGMRLR